MVLVHVQYMYCTCTMSAHVEDRKRNFQFLGINWSQPVDQTSNSSDATTTLVDAENMYSSIVSLNQVRLDQKSSTTLLFLQPWQQWDEQDGNMPPVYQIWTRATIFSFKDQPQTMTHLRPQMSCLFQTGFTDLWRMPIHKTIAKIKKNYPTLSINVVSPLPELAWAFSRQEP